MATENWLWGAPRINGELWRLGFTVSERSHASLDGHAPLTFADGNTVAAADLAKVRWVSHCRSLVQLPVAA
jgi:hypothetical protein